MPLGGSQTLKTTPESPEVSSTSTGLIGAWIREGGMDGSNGTGETVERANRLIVCVRCTQKRYQPKGMVCRECQHRQDIANAIKRVNERIAYEALHPDEVEEDESSILPVKQPRPTKALPGSKHKLEVLSERFNRREHLWHPKDATLEQVNERL
jgi:hypothetical protein